MENIYRIKEVPSHLFIWAFSGLKFPRVYVSDCIHFSKILFLLFLDLMIMCVGETVLWHVFGDRHEEARWRSRRVQVNHRAENPKPNRWGGGRISTNPEEIGDKSLEEKILVFFLYGKYARILLKMISLCAFFNLLRINY